MRLRGFRALQCNAQSRRPLPSMASDRLYEPTRDSHGSPARTRPSTVAEPAESAAACMTGRQPRTVMDMDVSSSEPPLTAAGSMTSTNLMPRLLATASGSESALRCARSSGETGTHRCLRSRG